MKQTFRCLQKRAYSVLCLAMLSVFYVACTNDNEEDLFGETDCSTEALSFQQDIQPIINTNCAVASCHVAGRQFPDFSDKENVIAHATEIKNRTRSRMMPPPGSGRSLTDAQIAQISCWVDSGAPDN